MIKNNINELAILGGAPLIEKTLHVGRPNIGNKKLFLEKADKILENAWLTNNGPFVREFEQKIQNRLKVKHCIAVCNGTIALEIAVRALEMTGEVIVPSFTFVATAHCLQWQEITPVFCDIDPSTFNLDHNKIEQIITPKTSGILAVNIWGRPCNIDLIQKIAHRHNLKLLFDSSHAFSCTHNGIHIGNFGNAEVFSFHATKFINTFEGGAIVTNDDTLAEKIKLMRNFGFSGMDNVIYLGTNGKMTEISAAMGITSLKSIDNFIEINQQNYKAYQHELNGIGGVRLIPFKGQDNRNFQYITIEIDESVIGLPRDSVMKILHAENILARRYFYPGCHKMEPYCSLYPEAGKLLPQTERLSEKILCLPTGTSITHHHIRLICSLIKLIAENGSTIKHRLNQLPL